MDIQTGLLVCSVDNLEKQLSCPICLDVFTKPVVILPCQHNLCRGCANDLYESKNPYHYSGGTFRCPTCRFQVVLDRHGVYGLQRNLLVENIIDIYKQQQDGDGGKCEEGPLKDKDTKEPMCKEHEDERINIFCVSCQTPTCSMCKVFGQHKDCQVSPLTDAYQSQKNQLRSAVELLGAGISSVQAVMEKMDHTCKLIQENGDQNKRHLGESFDLLYAILEDRKSHLLDHISRVEQEKLSALRKLAEQYEQQLHLRNQLQEKISQTLQIGSAAQFLVAAQQVQEEARRAAAAPQPERPEPGYESMEHLRLDTQEAEDVLAGMDFREEEEEA